MLERAHNDNVKTVQIKDDFTTIETAQKGTLAMFVLGLKFRPFAFETIAVLNPRDNGAARGARKGLISAV